MTRWTVDLVAQVRLKGVEAPTEAEAIKEGLHLVENQPFYDLTKTVDEVQINPAGTDVEALPWDEEEDTTECLTCFGSGTVFGITCGGCEGTGYLHIPPRSLSGAENA